MKRISNIYDEIISIDNLSLAHKNACRNKTKQRGVITFKKNLNANILDLHNELKLCNYISPEYKVFKIYEPKEREIFVLPYRDRIIQHAILQKVGLMFRRNLTKNTYSCIKGRGLHQAKRHIQEAFKDKESTKYCLKIDIVRFYPSVDHEILKSMLLSKIKDKRLISLLFAIINGADGLAIGNYISQTLGNFYLSPLDHYLKEKLKVNNCFRYCDDICVFAESKSYLHEVLHNMRTFLREKLNLEIKGNYQIFPVESRGVDFLGYVSYHGYSKLRKSIKIKYIRMLKHNKNEQSIASYNGWLKHANCINLKRKLENEN